MSDDKKKKRRRPAPRLSEQEQSLIKALRERGWSAPPIRITNLGSLEGKYDAFTNRIALNADSSRFTPDSPYVRGLPPFDEDVYRRTLAHEIVHQLDRPNFGKSREKLAGSVVERMKKIGASDGLTKRAWEMAYNPEAFAEIGAMALLDDLYGRDPLLRSTTRTDPNHARADTLSAALIPIISNMLGAKPKYALGGAIEVKGPRHEQGGVPLAGKEVEGGETLQKIGRATYVFSDRLRVPGTRETFAERHKALKKEGAPERETLRLVRMQERLNGPPQSKLFLGGILGSVLKYVPPAVNLVRGLFGRNETPEARLVDRGSLDYLNQMQTTVDVTPQLQEVRDQTRAVTADPAASAQHKLIAHANALRSSQSILSGKANAEAELTNQKMGALARQTAYLDMADQQALSQNDLLRMQGDAARENILGAGLSQLSSLYQQGRADKVGLAAATAQMNPKDRDVLLRRLGIGMDHTNPFWQRLRTFFSGSAPMPATPALPNDFGSVVSWRAPRPKLAR